MSLFLLYSLIWIWLQSENQLLKEAHNISGIIWFIWANFVQWQRCRHDFKIFSFHIITVISICGATFCFCKILPSIRSPFNFESLALKELDFNKGLYSTIPNLWAKYSKRRPYTKAGVRNESIHKINWGWRRKKEKKLLHRRNWELRHWVSAYCLLLCVLIGWFLSR